MKVFFSRAEYDRTTPWTKETAELAGRATRRDSLAGFEWTFLDYESALAFIESAARSGADRDLMVGRLARRADRCDD